jgi:BirA family transcriptional regulator, biotin operon repressor / biotin---[acetyl-CoA-carboxylase] ligase
MDEVAMRLETGPEGFTVVAAYQSSGRGRAGRSWQADPDDALLMSILLMPACAEATFRPFSVLASVAVARAVDGTTGVRSAIKWPNDLLLVERKAGGILTTTRLAGDQVRSATVGIGIDIARVPPALQETAIALDDVASRPVDRVALARSVTEELERLYNDVLSGRAVWALDEWHGRAAYMHERVSIEQGGKSLAGVMRGIAPDGSLRLEVETGEERLIVAGDLTRGPQLALQ